MGVPQFCVFTQFGKKSVVKVVIIEILLYCDSLCCLGVNVYKKCLSLLFVKTSSNLHQI